MKTKRKKLLAFGIIFSMLLAMSVVPASAAIVNSGTCGANLTWRLDDDGTLTISGTGDMTDYSSNTSPTSAPWRPKSISDTPIKTVIIQNGVTGIGDCAFCYCHRLTNITIPDSVTTIGEVAFYDCDSLTSITIPNSVTSIGDKAFRGCSKLTSITISNSVTSIGRFVFGNCSSLTSITIPDSVTSIGDYAFFYCRNITSVTIPDSVTSIGDQALYGCSSLTSVTIPDSVTSIGDGAFAGCSSLTGIEVSQNNQNYSLEDEVLFNNSKTTLIVCLGGKIGSYTIPDSVTSIGSHAFYDCDRLTSITIPNSVTSIGGFAFRNCSSLTDVYYGGTASQWNNISIGTYNDAFTSATIHYGIIFVNRMTDETDYDGGTVSLPDGTVLDTGENLNFRNGYVNTGNGYVKAGNKKITGNNVHFVNDGKIRLDAGETAKIEKDNGDGTTDQGFIVGIFNPTGIIRMILGVTGEVNETDYTGRTITKDFDFTNSEISGLVNFGFEVKRVPKPLELAIQSIE